MSEPQELPAKSRRVLGFVGLGLVLALSLGGSLWLGASSHNLSASASDSVAITQPSWGPLLRSGPAAPVVPLRLATCSVGDAAQNPALAQFSGVVLDPTTQDVVWSRNPTAAVTPASVMKIVTAAAALATLGPDHQLTTRVRTTDDPNTLVLVGGGDPTLSRLPVGSTSVYQGAPTLQELAEATIAALKERSGGDEDVVITTVIVDASLWDVNDAYDSTWSRDARNNGFISSVTALQVDGDRQDPAVELSRRGTDPVQRAGEAFVQALRDAGNAGRFVSVRKGQAPTAGDVVAQVSSRPVSELVAYMLKESDNTLAEMLARHVSLAAGLSGSSASLNDAFVSSLEGFGLDANQVVIRDGSGLSATNSVTPLAIASLLSELSATTGAFSSLLEGLPVAGVDGSLESRFTGPNEVARAQVVAKTGSISGVRSLAGFVNAGDEDRLVFAFFSEGVVGDDTRTALETLVVGLYTCGSNLADF